MATSVDLARFDVAMMLALAICPIEILTTTSLDDIHVLDAVVLPPILHRTVCTTKLDPTTVTLADPVAGPLLLTLLLIESELNETA